MKKVFLPILAVMAFIIVLGLLSKNNQFFTPINTLQTQTKPKNRVEIGSKTIEIEIANTPETRAKGLGGKTSLSDNNGMLFDFGQKGVRPNFWMKDMRMNIDIIWIANNEVIQIDKNAKAEPGVSDSQLKIYSSQKPVDYVLEVASGFSERNNIKVGSTFRKLSGL